LTPGVFIKALSGIPLENSHQDLKKVYPIELYIGGHLCNIGVGDEVTNSQGSNPGLITLFLSNQDTQLKWVKNFQQATGSYNIKDFYSYVEKKKKKKLLDKRMHTGIIDDLLLNEAKKRSQGIKEEEEDDELEAG